MQHADEPIKGTPDSPDLLNREKYACQIANGILTVPKSSGFVLSIEGSWGSGKTSFLNLIIKQFENLQAKQRPIVCSFNPWMIGSADALIHSFLVQLAASIGLSSHAKEGEKVARELISYSSIFTVLKFVPGAEPWASLAKDIFKAVGSATEKISSLKKLDIEQQRKAVTNSLRKLDQRIIVLIDDVDRLIPSEVFSMVRLIKAVCDFPGVIYVICYDPEYIDKALSSHIVEGTKGYLDKIVQTRLTLPKISKRDLAVMLNNEYDSLPDDARKEHFPKLSDRLSELYSGGIRYLLETPRDIKRLFNRIRFVEPGCRGEVNLADLMALEIIAIKAPSVYQHIHDVPAAYVGREPGVFTLEDKKEVIKRHADARNKALDSVNERLRDYIRELLKQLFPLPYDKLFQRTSEDAKARGFISAPDLLAIALSAGLPSGEVSYAAAVHYLLKSNEREIIISGLTEAVYLKRFVEQLRYAIKNNKISEPYDAIQRLGIVIDSPIGVAAENTAGDFFDVGLARNIWWLSVDILEAITPNDRRKILINLITDKTLLTLGTSALSQLHAQHGTFPDQAALTADKQWVNASMLKDLTAKWSRMID